MWGQAKWIIPASPGLMNRRAGVERVHIALTRHHVIKDVNCFWRGTKSDSCHQSPVSGQAWCQCQVRWGPPSANQRTGKCSLTNQKPEPGSGVSQISFHRHFNGHKTVWGQLFSKLDGTFCRMRARLSFKAISTCFHFYCFYQRLTTKIWIFLQCGEYFTPL